MRPRWQSVLQRISAWRGSTWVLANTLPRIDRLFMKLSHGRRCVTQAVAGLPVVMLTTIGAKSRRPRKVPLLGIRDKDRVVVIADNFGRAYQPAWYRNLQVTPEATIALGGETQTYVARPATDVEHAIYWRQAVEVYAGYRIYERRARGRQFPIVVLTPKPVE